MPSNYIEAMQAYTETNPPEFTDELGRKRRLKELDVFDGNWFELGLDLLYVRENKIFRDLHLKSFQAYIESRIPLGKSECYKILQCTKQLQSLEKELNISLIGVPIPISLIKKFYSNNTPKNEQLRVIKTLYDIDSIGGAITNEIISEISNELVYESDHKTCLRVALEKEGETTETEVSTPVGKIDLTTNAAIIEIKRTDDWKSALGQILAYGFYFPNKRKIIYLFGKPQNKALKMEIETLCDYYDVKVFWNTGSTY